MGHINPSPECAQTRTQDILAKLASASGPDRELDASIYCAFFNEPDSVARATVGGGVIIYGPGMSARIADVAAYTASLDAALALVAEKLPGWWWEIKFFMTGPVTNGYLATLYPDGDTPEWERIDPSVETGPTPAIAVLKALFDGLSKPEAAR